MPRPLLSLTWLLFLTLAALPLQGAESALDAVSTDASAVVRFKNPKASIAKTAEMAELIKKGLGDRVRDAEIGKLISNPDLKGVDMESDWWLAVYATSGKEEPGLVFLIPATDLSSMKKAVGDDVKFMEHGKLGVYTSDEDSATKTVARIKGEGKSISTLIDKDSSAVFETGDLSVFINVAQLAVEFKSDIANAMQQFQEQIENANLPGMFGGMDPKELANLVGQLVGFVKQGLDDTQSCTVATMVSKDGLSFEDLVKLKAGTATDKLLAKSPPGPLTSLSSLPAGYLIYWGLTWNMSDFSDLNQLLMGFGGNALGERSKEVAALLAEVGKLKVGSTVGAYGLGDPEEGAVRSVSVTEVDNPQKMRDLSRKIVKEMGTIETQGIKQIYELKTDAEKFGTNSADLITMRVEVDDPNNPAAAMALGVTNALLGPDGMQTRVVYLKDRVVQTVGGGKQAMTAVLAALEKKTGDSKSPAQQTRAKLGAKTNLAVLLDLANTIGKALNMIVERGLPLPIDPDDVKALQGKPSFFALGAATEPQGLRVKTILPVEQMAGMSKIIDFALGFLQGIGAGFGAPVEEGEEN